MKALCFFLLSFLPVVVTAQNGSAANPYIALGQARHVPAAGVYHFNLSGTAFSTYVDASGYVQVAIDFGNGAGNLPASTSLTQIARGILNITVLAKLTAATELKLTSSTGNLHATTTNATLISRVLTNATLHKGPVDNAINDFWNGTGSALLTGDATCTTNSGTTLPANIFHPCGNGNTFHWIPGGDFQRETWNAGEVANDVRFQLWVRAESYPLPVELLRFDARKTATRSVQLSWATAAEFNSDYFEVQRSGNAADWQVASMLPAAGHSLQTLSYTWEDPAPYAGVSYYRLKQVDLDGTFTYSAVQAVETGSHFSGAPQVFPNPFDHSFYITDTEGLLYYRLVNIQGQDFTRMTVYNHSGGKQARVDCTALPPGMYILYTGTHITRVVKR